MMSLCKTVHGLLGFPDPDDRCRSVPRRRRRVPPPSDAAGLRCVARELPTPPATHVVESAAVGPRPPVLVPPTSPSSPSPSAPTHEKQQPSLPVERIDEGSRGLSYLYGGGGGGGLELCTESLGFESCCDGKMGAEEEKAEREIRRRIEEDEQRSSGRREVRSTRRKGEVREFPPPLPWLSAGGADGGRCCSFLKAVRKDGRFVLTQVRIERPEVLRASRQDGRLRLELVKPQVREAEEENISEVEEAVAEKVEEVEAEEEEEREQVEEEEEEERPRWRLPAAMERRDGGGGGFRSGRCQEAVRDQGLSSSSSSPFWGTRFVTTA